MSYKYEIIKDSPKYYWDISSSAAGTTASVYNSGSIVASATSATIFTDNMASASSYFVFPKYSTPPLVMGSVYSLSIQSGGQLLFPNKTSTLYSKSENGVISFEFWFSFDNSFDGSGYVKNASASSRYFVDNELDIMQIVDTSGVMGVIKFNYVQNAFIFSLNGTNSQDATYVVNDLSGTFHIYAYYAAGTTGIIINGIPGSQGYCYTTFSNPKSSSNIYFVFEPSSISNATQYFIDDFAVYDYLLSIDQIYSHMKKAFYGNDYAYESYFSQISYFDAKTSEIDLLYSKKYSGSNFINSIGTSNLDITSNGLRNRYIQPISLYTDYGSGMTVQSGSADMSASGGAIFYDIGKYILRDQMTLTGQFYKSSTLSTNTLFSISGVNGSDYIWGQVTPTDYRIYYYYASTETSTALITKSITTPSAGWHNFGFSSDGSTLYLYTDDGVTSSVSYNAYYSPDSNLLIGNFEKNIVNNSNISFKNIGFFNTRTKNFSTIDFTDNKMFMIKFNGNLNVSQAGYWKARVPLSINPSKLVGTQLEWSSIDNCKVEVSKDNGNTWNTTYSNSFITGASANMTPAQVSSGNVKDYVLKVTLYTDDVVSEKTPTFNNLNVLLYGSLDIYSKDKLYLIKPLQNSAGQNSYIKYIKDRKINSRPSNLGLFFQNSSSTTGYAGIYPQTGASAYALEFWFRLNNLPSSGLGYLLSPHTTGPSVYISSTSKKLVFSSASVYINGASVSSNSLVMSTNNIYHMIVAFSAPYTSSVMYLNGASGAGIHANATYGNIGIWNYDVTPDAASTRYLSYVSSRSTTVADIADSSTFIIPDRTKDSVSIYRI